MPHFFINSDDIITNNSVLIKDLDTVKHLSCALRLKAGEQLDLIDKDEFTYKTVVKSVSKKEILFEVVDKFPSNRKLKYDISLIQGILKPDGQALLVSGATQVGVCEIYPILSDNCAVAKKTVEGKIEKWQKISDEAMKQCERANFLKIQPICKLEEVLSDFKKENIIAFCERFENTTLDEAVLSLDISTKIAVVIGPEGGFSNNEFEYFVSNNIKRVGLGNLILRAPNAVVAGIFGITSRLK